MSGNLNYSQTSGQITDDDGNLIATGFAGNDSRPIVNPNRIHGFNNPDAQNLHKIGPLPQGVYEVGSWGDHPPLGLFSATLTQISRESYGRDGFWIHGESSTDPLNSSEGCIVLGHSDRLAVMNLNPQTITVTV
jgi:hypothetical protein